VVYDPVLSNLKQTFWIELSEIRVWCSGA
jgi:hypothetical protein